MAQTQIGITGGITNNNFQSSVYTWLRCNDLWDNLGINQLLKFIMQTFDGTEEEDFHFRKTLAVISECLLQDILQYFCISKWQNQNANPWFLVGRTCRLKLSFFLSFYFGI